MMAIPHDHDCRMRRYPGTSHCSCGASETQRIIDEICAKFGDELKKIMARPVVTDEEMNRPRFFPSRVRPPNGIENAKRIRKRLAC